MNLPEWLRYDPEDPEQRRQAGMALAILFVGGVIAFLRQIGIF